MKDFKEIVRDIIGQNAQWHEKSIRYTGSVRCPDCGGPITQTRRIVPGNTKSVECKNCKKYRLIPRDKWESYSDAGQIMER